MDDLAAHIAMPSLITGIIFTLLGSALMTSPPSEINPLVGYRTKRSMRSQESWDFAQRYAAGRMAAGGIVMIALSLVSYFIPVNAGYKQMAGIALLVLCCIYMIGSTEIALNKKFPKPKK